MSVNYKRGILSHTFKSTLFVDLQLCDLAAFQHTNIIHKTTTHAAPFLHTMTSVPASDMQLTTTQSTDTLSRPNLPMFGSSQDGASTITLAMTDSSPSNMSGESGWGGTLVDLSESLPQVMTVLSQRPVDSSEALPHPAISESLPQSETSAFEQSEISTTSATAPTHIRHRARVQMTYIQSWKIIGRHIPFTRTSRRFRLTDLKRATDHGKLVSDQDSTMNQDLSPYHTSHAMRRLTNTK